MEQFTFTIYHHAVFLLKLIKINKASKLMFQSKSLEAGFLHL